MLAFIHKDKKLEQEAASVISLQHFLVDNFFFVSRWGNAVIIIPFGLRI
jgi:hypothetical protein